MVLAGFVLESGEGKGHPVPKMGLRGTLEKWDFALQSRELFEVSVLCWQKDEASLCEELGIAALGNYCLLTPRDLPKVTYLMQRGFSFPSESDQCGKAQRSVNQPPNLDQANRIPLYKTGVVEWFFLS